MRAAPSRLVAALVTLVPLRVGLSRVEWRAEDTVPITTEDGERGRDRRTGAPVLGGVVHVRGMRDLPDCAGFGMARRFPGETELTLVEGDR
jgi:hypothetical protein